jgi:hypothetical protein
MTKSSALKRAIGIVVGCFILITFFQNCGDVNVQQSQDFSSTGGPSQAVKSEFCTTPQANVITNLKTIFIVDRSGSNGSSTGTDPDKIKRFTPMLEFVGSQVQSENIQWLLIPFNEDARVLPESGFTSDKESFLEIIRDEIDDGDGGNTSYRNALNKAIATIQSDIDAAKRRRPIVSSSYVIFFVSDGKPGKLEGGIFKPEKLIDVYGKVDELMAIRDFSDGLVDGIQLNTGFYTNQLAADPEAVSVLTEMSRLGKGRFIPFTGVTSIDFRAFASLTRQSRLELKEVWAFNASGVWEDREFRKDIDGDGLSDPKELELGSSPDLKDSDGNGVRDGIEHQLYGHPCNSPNCTGIPRQFAECGLQPITGYLDEDKDFLNACEESLLRSSDINFDSTRQFVPDEIIWRSGLSFNSSGELQVDSDWDGITNYHEIKRGLPIDENNANLAPFSQTQINLNRISSNQTQSCYNLQVDGLHSFGDEDEIHIFLIESSNVVNRTKRIRSLVAPASRLGRPFSDGDFR